VFGAHGSGDPCHEIAGERAPTETAPGFGQIAGLDSATPDKSLRDFTRVEQRPASVSEVLRRGETLLIPWIGPNSPLIAACFRGMGIPTECLPLPDAEALRHGRRQTSGKECLPMCLTLGNLLKRLERERDTDSRFAVLMTTTHGPCREGTYNLLNQITLERLGWTNRVRIWPPADTGYFDDMPGGLAALVFSTMMASDLLQGALHDVRPVENRPGAAQEIYDRRCAQLLHRVEAAASGDLSLPAAVWQIATGRLFGLTRLLAEAAREFAAVRSDQLRPTVLVVGEVYARCEAFANNFIIDKLEARGLKARLAPLSEWIEYTSLINLRKADEIRWGDRLSGFLQQRIQDVACKAVARPLQWTGRSTVAQALEAVEPYLRDDLHGEAVLTVGGPLEEWRNGKIDAVVSVGPLECMPNKIAEAQLFHVAEQEGLLALTLSLNGEPVDEEVLDNFAFEVLARFGRRRVLPFQVPLPHSRFEAAPRQSPP
jgi:predicted nucleotide-binding protein (sugar kinase/HSP70/actin superfamily)